MVIILHINGFQAFIVLLQYITILKIHRTELSEELEIVLFFMERK